MVLRFLDLHDKQAPKNDSKGLQSAPILFSFMLDATSCLFPLITGLPCYRQFNTGSPFSVPAGHSADLTELIAFYHKKSADNEARKVEKLRARAENSTK